MLSSQPVVIRTKLGNGPPDLEHDGLSANPDETLLASRMPIVKVWAFGVFCLADPCVPERQHVAKSFHSFESHWSEMYPLHGTQI